jgi:hypothetical protein
MLYPMGNSRIFKSNPPSTTNNELYVIGYEYLIDLDILVGLGGFAGGC